MWPSGSTDGAKSYLADWICNWEEDNKKYTDHWCHSRTNSQPKSGANCLRCNLNSSPNSQNNSFNKVDITRRSYKVWQEIADSGKVDGWTQHIPVGKWSSITLALAGIIHLCFPKAGTLWQANFMAHPTVQKDFHHCFIYSWYHQPLLSSEILKNSSQHPMDVLGPGHI